MAGIEDAVDRSGASGAGDPRRFTDSGIEVAARVRRGRRARSWRIPGCFRSRAGSTAEGYRSRLWTMRQYAGYASARESNERFRYLLAHGSTGLSMAFDLPTQLGLDSDDPRALGRGGPHGGRDRLDRGHAHRVRRDPAGRGLDVDDDQRAGRGAAVPLRAGRGGAGRAGGGAARDGAERHPQGVHRARELHLPAGAVDAADDRPVRLLPRADPELEHDLDLGLSLPREGLLGGAGGRVHARRAGSPTCRPRWTRASRSTSSRRGSRSSSTRTTTSSRRSRSSAPPGGCGRGSCASASARGTSAR